MHIIDIRKPKDYLDNFKRSRHLLYRINLHKTLWRNPAPGYFPSRAKIS